MPSTFYRIVQESPLYPQNRYDAYLRLAPFHPLEWCLVVMGMWFN